MRIIPGYFIPIWAQVMCSRKDYAFRIISKITLIPKGVLDKYGKIYESKDEYVKEVSNEVDRVYVYFDYKYCVVHISKRFYKRVCLEGEGCLDDMDLGRGNDGEIVKICISFEDSDEFISRKWERTLGVDYLFLSIGVKYLENVYVNKSSPSDLEKLLYLLVVDKEVVLKRLDTDDLTGIIMGYANDRVYQDWFRTYRDYMGYRGLVNYVVSTLR